MNAEPPDSDLTPEHALRRCVVHTLADLRRSVRRNRMIPLPTLLRLFKRRWAEVDTSETFDLLKQAGLDTIRAHYRRQQIYSCLR